MFGGNNPLFIPGHTNEKEYDEVYVNNNFDQYNKERKQKLASLYKVSKIGMDVDFLKNLQD